MQNLYEKAISHVSEIMNKKFQKSKETKIENFSKYLEIFQDDPELLIMQMSLQNILKMPVPKNINDIKLYQKSVGDIFNAINVFVNLMCRLNNINKESLSIERKLFSISFIPKEDNTTTILPVFLKQLDFLTAESSYLNLISSTGSGKTRTAPFIFSIKSQIHKMKMPFIIMTQLNNAIISDKMQDFQEIIGDSVNLTSNQVEFESYYNKKINKPVVGIFTPRLLIKILINAKNMKYDLIKRSRFVLDEVHERSIDIDVLIAILSKEMQQHDIPMHLLMMTATPDDRLFRSFNKEIKNILLPNTQLFPITDEKKEVNDFGVLDVEVRDSALSIINKMVDGTVKPGHILIFTSGNHRINNLMNMISILIGQLSEKNEKVTLLKNLEKFMKSKELFYGQIDETIVFDENSNDKLYFVIMKYAGFLSEIEREIAKEPIPNYPNVIKIIVATNSIESSITIDGLAAVIDSGIRNAPKYDKEIGITTLVENSISTQSQIQRRGRVGRVREGICVQFTINGHPPAQYTEPAIVTNDISSNILDFKRIGLDIEKIDNLPEPGISQETMENYINDLIAFKALDSEHKLTQTGKKLAMFPSLAPFLSSSILTVSKKYENDKLAMVAGALIFLIIGTNNIVSDPTSDCFRKNFCEDSDIITLLLSIIDVMKANGNIRKKLEKSGFNIANTLKLIGSIGQIISIIFENENENDSQIIWNNLCRFCTKNDMMHFIKLMLIVVNKNRPKWISYRKASYITVINVLDSPSFVYNLDNTNEPIKIRKRPGGKGFAAPGACYIMQIQRLNDNTCQGSIIHRDLSRIEISHPQVIETLNFMNNVFCIPLIEASLSGHKNKFDHFQMTHFYNKNATNGLLCYYEQFGNKTIISYVSKTVNDNEVQNLMIDAIKNVEKIIPYAPRTILVRNDVLKAIVAVTNVGANNFISKVILYTDSNPIPYQIDNNSIDYLIKHLNELNSLDDHLVIAVTGEKFSYLNDEEYNGFPNTSSDKPWVFMEKSYNHSHLVILSDTEIPNGKRLRWVDPKIHVTYSDVDSLVHASNMIYRGIVKVSHDDDIIYGMSENTQVIYDQKRKRNNIFKLDFNGMTQRSEVFRPIGCMFDRFAMDVIKGHHLIKDVDLQSFRLSNKLKQCLLIKCKFLDKEIKAMSAYQMNNQQIDPYKLIKKIPEEYLNFSVEKVRSEQNEIYQKIQDYKKERAIIIQEYTNPGINKQLNKKKQAEFKILIDNSYCQLNSKKESVKLFEEFKQQFCNENGIDIKSFESLKELNSNNSKKAEIELDGLHKNKYYLEIECDVDEREMILKTIKQKNLKTEVIPLCKITINHEKSSNLNADSFKQKIREICSRFGAVIKEESEYQDLQTINKKLKQIVIYTGEFSIPFAGEIKQALGKLDKVQFKFPTKIIPPCLINRPCVITIIDQWIRKNKLNFKREGYKYYGNSEEISKVMVLLSKKETQIKIPYRSFPIPGGIEIEKVVFAINKKNLKLPYDLKWGIDRSNRIIYTTYDFEDKEILELIQKSSKIRKQTKNEQDENAIIYDYFNCCEDEALLSGCQIPLYQKDGSAQMKNFCINCCYDLFKFEVDRLFDAGEDMPKIDLLAENVQMIKFIPVLSGNTNDIWPHIPLGQLLWCLTSEPTLNAVTKTWFSAIVFQALHCSQYLDFCPDHPSILMRVTGGRMKCKNPGCQMFPCEHCKRWHKPGQCSVKVTLPPGYRICPWCNRPVEKTEACNHIACKCGKHFCFYCGFKGETSGEIYNHLSKDHKGCFDNPPDYKKYYLNLKVSDKELKDFYKKYPQFKSLTNISS